MAYEEVVKATTLTHGPANRFVNKIFEGQEDVSLLLVGDSASDQPGGWPYMLARWLASTYRTHSVSYLAWNPTHNSYAAAVVLPTGSARHAAVRLCGDCGPTYLLLPASGRAGATGPRGGVITARRVFRFLMYDATR